MTPMAGRLPVILDASGGQAMIHLTDNPTGDQVRTRQKEKLMRNAMLLSMFVALTTGCVLETEDSFLPEESEQALHQVDTGERHCFIRIEPLAKGAAKSLTSKMECFATPAEAVAAVVGDGTRVPISLQASEITPELYEAISPASVLIGLDYTDPNYLGSSLQWIAPTGCFYNNGGPSYSGDMPPGWDNVISSARSFSNCRAIIHADYFGGAGINIPTGCDAPTVPFLDNKVSNQRWTDQTMGEYCRF